MVTRSPGLRARKSAAISISARPGEKVEPGYTPTSGAAGAGAAKSLSIVETSLTGSAFFFIPSALASNISTKHNVVIRTKRLIGNDILGRLETIKEFSYH